jgi:hypothetical protein
MSNSNSISTSNNSLTQFTNFKTLRYSQVTNWQKHCHQCRVQKWQNFHLQSR